jgi:DNA-binding MarR family transcriptional regulator
VRDAERHGIALGQVLELAVLLTEDMTESLARDGLTVPRARVLWQLHRGGPCTQRVLAEALDVSPRNITGLVDGLVATGFVTRQPHPKDRRATLVSFTARGARTVRKLDAAREQLAESLFAGMSDKQFDGLVEGLDALLVRLREELSKMKGGRSS